MRNEKYTLSVHRNNALRLITIGSKYSPNISFSFSVKQCPVNNFTKSLPDPFQEGVVGCMSILPVTAGVERTREPRVVLLDLVVGHCFPSVQRTAAETVGALDLVVELKVVDNGPQLATVDFAMFAAFCQQVETQNESVNGKQQSKTRLNLNY